MREEAVRREKLRVERKLAQQRAKQREVQRQKVAALEAVNAYARRGGRWSISRPCYEGLLTMAITQPSDSDSAEEDDFESGSGGIRRPGERTGDKKLIAFEEHIDRSMVVRNAEGCEEPHSDEPELWNIDGTEVDLRAKYKAGGQMWYLQSRAQDAIKGERPIAGSPMNRVAVLSHRKYRADEPVAAPAAPADESPLASPKPKEKQKREKIRRSGIVRNAEGCEEPHSDEPELWNIDGTEVDLRAKYKAGGQMWYLQSRALDAIKGERPIAGSPMNIAAVSAGRKFKAD